MGIFSFLETNFDTQTGPKIEKSLDSKLGFKIGKMTPRFLVKVSYFQLYYLGFLKKPERYPFLIYVDIKDIAVASRY